MGSARHFIASEWPAFAILGFTFLTAALGVAFVQPAYAQMFADFGHVPPPFTRFCLSPWFFVAFALLCTATVALRVALASRPLLRTVLILLLLALTLGVPLLFLSAMRMPLFLMAT